MPGQTPIAPDVAKKMVEAVDAAGGNISRAATALGIPRPTLDNRLRAAKLQGIEPRPRVNVTGTSTLYGRDGEQMLQWVKADNKRSPDEWAAAVKDVFADTRPVKRIPMPKRGRSDLLACYPIGDHHVAMYAWAEEAGADYDIKIADRLLVSAAAHLVDMAPDSDEALIVNVGDFFHVDTLKNETSRSGNTLDVDTRYAAMIRAGVKMLRAFIEKALCKHRRVKVICVPGNHDDLGALWLSLTLAMMYESNPRVTIDNSPGKFRYHRHGKVLIGVTHGDTVKLDALGGVMATDQPEAWGQTQHRYWLTGHIHQRKTIELPGVMVESFRTLAARDAWATAAGYRSGRDMTSIVFHNEHGEVMRHRCDVSMLEA